MKLSFLEFLRNLMCSLLSDGFLKCNRKGNGRVFVVVSRFFFVFRGGGRILWGSEGVFSVLLERFFAEVCFFGHRHLLMGESLWRGFVCFLYGGKKNFDHSRSENGVNLFCCVDFRRDSMKIRLFHKRLYLAYFLNQSLWGW